MKTSFWIVIVVVVFFIGFLIGYSLSPAGQPATTGGTAAVSRTP
jgi:hypothetical protein